MARIIRERTSCCPTRCGPWPFATAADNELRADINTLRTELRADINTLRTELNNRIDGLATTVADIDRRVARLEGMFSAGVPAVPASAETQVQPDIEAEPPTPDSAVLVSRRTLRKKSRSEDVDG